MDAYSHNFIKNSREGMSYVPSPRPFELIRVRESMPRRSMDKKLASTNSRHNSSIVSQQHVLTLRSSPVSKPQNKHQQPKPGSLLPLLITDMGQGARHAKSFSESQKRALFSAFKPNPAAVFAVTNFNADARSGHLVASRRESTKLAQTVGVGFAHSLGTCNRSQRAPATKHPTVGSAILPALPSRDKLSDYGVVGLSPSVASQDEEFSKLWTSKGDTRVFEGFISRRRARLRNVIKEICRARAKMASRGTSGPQIVSQDPESSVVVPTQPDNTASSRVTKLINKMRTRRGGGDRPERGLARVVLRLKRIEDRKRVLHPGIEMRQRLADYGKWYLRPSEYGRNVMAGNVSSIL